MQFRYIARNKATGARVGGVIEAPDKQSAVRRIEQMGHVPVSLELYGAPPTGARQSRAPTLSPLTLLLFVLCGLVFVALASTISGITAATVLAFEICLALFVPLLSPALRNTKYGRHVKQNLAFYIAVAPCTTAMIIGVINVEIPMFRVKAAEPAFASHIDEYLSLPITGTNSYRGQQRPRIGRMVVLDRSKRQIHTFISAKLPSKFLARRPEDVDSVVWIDWQTEVVGSYSDSKEAARNDAVVAVIDKASGVLLCRTTVMARPPPKTKHRGASGVTWAIPEVIDYLKTIARESVQ